MAKISTYPLDGSPNLGDKLIGTDVNDSNATKNLTVGQILSVPGSSTYVPYTGAINDLDLGSYTIFATLTQGKLWYGDSSNVNAETTSALEYYPTSPAGGAVVKMNSRLYADVTSQDNATSLVIGKGAGLGMGGTTNIGVGAGFNNASAQNTLIGYNAGKLNVSTAAARFNTAVGFEAMGGAGAYGENNTFVGYTSGAYSLGGSNTGLGYKALFDVGAGIGNTAVGENAMYQSGGDNNSALGINALGEASGNNNVGIGNSAGFNHVGNSSVFIGESAGASNAASTVIAIGNFAASTNSGATIVAIGSSALDQNTASGAVGIGLNSGLANTGSELVAIGREAAVNNSGSNLISIGAETAGGNIGTGVIAIGYAAGNGNTFDNVVLLGENASATANNQMAVLANPVGSIMTRIDYNNVTADREVNFPNADGTFVLSINGSGPNAAGDITIPTGWGILGNAGTNETVNFIGTTDNQDVVFKANNTERLRIDTTSGDIITPDAFRAVGTNTFLQATSSLGTESIAIGQNATDKGYISITAGAGNTAKIRGVNLTGARVHELPNADGTFVLSVNNTAPNAAGNVSVSLQNILNTDNSLTVGNNFQGTGAGSANSGIEVIGFGTSACQNNTGDDVVAFGLDAAGGNTGNYVNAFGIGAGQTNSITGATMFANLTLPTYANFAAASAAITVVAGASPGSTYLYHDQATNSIGAVRIP